MKNRLDLFPEDGSDDRGVSPVIGVILMVAITVILAAVIGTFVLNLSGSVSQQASAGVTVENESGDTSIITVNSLGDKTDGVICRGAETNDGSKATSVGSQFDCGDDGTLVAYSTGTDIENKTIKTL